MSHPGRCLLVTVALCFAMPWAVGGGESARADPASAATTGVIPLASLKSGQEVYVAVCSGCHDSGLAGAPKVGDKAAWASRLSEGMGLLYLHSLKGYHGKAGVMPARGGRADLPVELVKQSVDYMVARSN